MSVDILNRSIYWKLFPVLLASVLVCGIGVWVGTPIFTERGVKSDALANAEKTVKQFKVIRAYYTENVISKAVESGALNATYTHKGADDEIPLPATFIHELSDLLAETGTTLRLYSPYPFPVRAQRDLDDFGKSAWEALSKNPDEPFVRTETIAGRDVVRVAVADTMVSQVCVDCHNSRADTPKDDWELNDLRGVLEIDTDVTEALDRGAWIGRGIALSLLGLLGAALALTFFRMRNVVIGPVGTLTNVMGTLAMGNLEVDIPDQGRLDEIGDMARALGVFKRKMAEAVRAKAGLDCVSVGVTITDNHGVFIYANRSALDLFASLESQLHGATSHVELPDLIGTDSGQVLHHIGMEGLDLKSLSPGTPRQLDVADRTLTVVADPVVDRFGNPLGSVVGWDDITERRKVEEEIRQLNEDLEQRVRERTNSLTELNRALESEVYERGRTNAELGEAKTRLGAIMDNLADGLITIDESGNIESVNPATETLFGYAEADLLGRNVSLLMTGPDAGRHDQYIEAYKRSNKARVLRFGAREVTGKRKNGSVFPMELAVSDMWAGDRCQFIGLLRDVTERKKAEADLRARANQQGAVAELGRYALVDSDLAALMNRATVLVSQTLEIEYCSILDLLPNGDQFWLRAGAGWADDLIGQTTVDASPETPAGLALRSGEPVIVENLSTEKRFGDVSFLVEHKVVSGVSVIIEGRDRAFGVLEVHSTGFRPFSDADIAFLKAVSNVLSAAVERKRAEDKHEQLTAQLFQSQKMEAIGQLAAGVAHDFNNILMIIDGYTRLAQKGPGLSDEARAPLDHVLKAAGKAAGLTKQLLAFGRQQHLETKVTSVSKMMSEVEALLGPLLEETINLNISVSEDQIFVDTDVSQLTQTLVNLAINARDAMPRGGSITITAERTDADEGLLARHPKLSAGSYLRIDVADDGEGMDEETLACIFDPFFTTKEQGKGTGLGLAMVYGFVDQSEGVVEVHSEVGHGTTFSVYLPTTERPEAIELNAMEQNLNGNGETVLLAEDDETLRDLVRLMLEELGYSVITAADGFEALEVESEYDKPIDLLLSDVVMPNLGGIELARELLETRPDMKVLLISGYPSRGDIKRIDLPEDIPLLHKPCPPERLARAIRDVLEGKGVSQG